MIPGPTLKELMENYERALIVEALTKCKGNSFQAAKYLGMSRHLMVAKRRKYGLPLAVEVAPHDYRKRKVDAK